MHAANEPVQETRGFSAHGAFSTDKEDDAEKAGGLPLFEKANVHNKRPRAEESSSEYSVYSYAHGHFKDNDRSS